MEKTINIDGQDVPFRISASTYIHYRNQMGTEYECDLAELRKNEDKTDLRAIRGFIWAAAKTADRRIREPEIWFDRFEKIDAVSVWVELVSDKKPKNETDTEKSENESENEKLTSSLLMALCAEMGLTFNDLDNMSVEAFFETVEKYCELKKGNGGERNATAEDIADFKNL